MTSKLLNGVQDDGGDVVGSDPAYVVQRRKRSGRVGSNSTGALGGTDYGSDQSDDQLTISEFYRYSAALDDLHEQVLAHQVPPYDEWWAVWADAVSIEALPSLTASQAWDLLVRWWRSHERAHVLVEWVREGLVWLEALVEPIDPSELNVPLPLVVWAGQKAGGADTRDWVRLFKATGFLSDGAPIPTEPMTVYRGHSLGRWHGMSWTTDPDCANGFAEWHNLDGRGLVFKATVPPEVVLARYERGGESEVIINPFCLRGTSDRRGSNVECIGLPNLEAVDRWLSNVAESWGYLS
jgi:hypothetical protein